MVTGAPGAGGVETEKEGEPGPRGAPNNSSNNNFLVLLASSILPPLLSSFLGTPSGSEGGQRLWGIKKEEGGLTPLKILKGLG